MYIYIYTHTIRSDFLLTGFPTDRISLSGAASFLTIDTNGLIIDGYLPKPVDKDQLVTGGYWSSYWYNGRIYATEIARGLDVFALEPSEFLTPAEIAAAEAAQYEGNVFNPQTQTQVTWPAEVVEAAVASRQGG